MNVLFTKMQQCLNIGKVIYVVTMVKRKMKKVRNMPDILEAYVKAFKNDKIDMSDYVRIIPSVDPYTGNVHVIGTNGNKALRLDIIRQSNGTYAIFGNRLLLQILGGRSEAGGSGGILDHIHEGRFYDI